MSKKMQHRGNPTYFRVHFWLQLLGEELLSHSAGLNQCSRFPLGWLNFFPWTQLLQPIAAVIQT